MRNEPKSSYRRFCAPMYAVSYPSACATSQRTGAWCIVVKSASGARPVHVTTHDVKVPDDCDVSLPSATRSGAASSRKRALQPSEGAEHIASARTLSLMTSRTFGRCAGATSGGSGSGSRSEMPRRAQPLPVTPSWRACATPWMKHVSGGAAWSERDSTKSTQKQYDAASEARERQGDAGRAHATRRPARGGEDERRRRRADEDHDDDRRPPGREPRAERPAQRDAEAHGVARHVRMKDAEVEELPAEAEGRQREDEERRIEAYRDARRPAPRRQEPRNEPQRPSPEARARQRRAEVVEPLPRRKNEEASRAQREVERDREEGRDDEEEDGPRAVSEDQAAKAPRAQTHGGRVGYQPAGRRRDPLVAGSTVRVLTAARR